MFSDSYFFFFYQYLWYKIIFMKYETTNEIDGRCFVFPLPQVTAVLQGSRCKL